ncbi:SUKH-4 family immunity protein [Streptomyces endophyticus]|uniref:SUKH-4 family immunity protein n=1 Tax=Streptomyces endophyticus TaxID=714166 RepID=A0ABU6F5T5_9ACTN|nr:SUKH-4 family immunity protein [Streptomyces endophyticus]MEB8339384.1 SUKH-4 family immunity protein [Streptomyces endophyticus]
MISQEQALATAEGWLNPEGQTRREVRVQEFDLGWVVWAAAPPMERDPVTGKRRPPATIGHSCGVVDRRTGELSTWPSVPVEEVVRMYQQKHGGGQETAPPAQPPVTGPGNTAVFTYVDPATGEETSLAVNSAPGEPHSEIRALGELQRRGVPTQNVVAIHTDLSSSLLPGGYPGLLLGRRFPQARFSCAQEYGLRGEERAEAVAGLVEHVEQMHRIAGQEPPPRPHRAPVPTDVEPAEPLRDVALGRELTEAFGADDVRRYDADDVAGAPLPEATKATLTWAGLPADVPFFFTGESSQAQLPGGLFGNAAAHLREIGSQAGTETLAFLEGHVRIGTDGVALMTVQCTGSELEGEPVGQVWAVTPENGAGRRVNASVSAFARSLALLHTTREEMIALGPVLAGSAVADLQKQLVAIDASALDDPRNWWSVIVEQMWHGLF